MSKSKGNVVYLDDLLTEGYRPEHVRFYLIYGHYRRKLNSTGQRISESSRKLDRYQEMAKSFEDQQSCSENSDRKAKTLIASITVRFGDSMSNDLDVKHAFDSVFKTLVRLDTLRMRGRLSKDDLRRTAQALRKVDSVLQLLP